MALGRRDFGRSTLGSNTFRFKKQWGAQPEPAVWQYYVRKGQISDMRRELALAARRAPSGLKHSQLTESCFNAHLWP